MTEVVVMVTDSEVIREAEGFETKAIGLSLGVEERPVVGQEGEEVEVVLEELEGMLGFSVDQSLEGVGVVVVVLVLATSGRGLNLETGVFVGKSLRGVTVFIGDSNFAQLL